MTYCYPMHLVPLGAAPYSNSNEIHHRVQLRPIKHDVVWQHTTKRISTGAPGAQTGCKTCTRCRSMNSEWLTQWQHLPMIRYKRGQTTIPNRIKLRLSFRHNRHWRAHIRGAKPVWLALANRPGSASAHLPCHFYLKLKGQGHGWGHTSKSKWGSNILSTHIPFVPCQSSLPFLSYDFFQNLTLKFKGQGYGWGHSSKSQCGSNILSTHIPSVPCQLALPFLKYSIFKIWPWKSRVKVKWLYCCTTTGLDNSIELRMV